MFYLKHQGLTTSVVKLNLQPFEIQLFQHIVSLSQYRDFYSMEVYCCHEPEIF